MESAYECSINHLEVMELQTKDFHHPYSPYNIQIQFMRALYTCLEDGKVAIFESPTGRLDYMTRQRHCDPC